MSRDVKRIRVELLRYLRGKQLWEAGTIFDTKNGPLPKDIMHEVERARKDPKTAKVRFLAIPEEEESQDPAAAAKAAVEKAALESAAKAAAK